MRVVIDLSEEDLEHFRAAMRRAKAAAQDLTPEQITGAAQKLFEDTQGQQVPEFVSSRMKRLGTLIGMVHDKNWGISDSERNEILSALTYFSDPQDAIPDTIPVLGFLDDAIMIELVVEELKHEIDAYEDFLLFRSQAAEEQGPAAASGLNRDDWLEQRQNELLDRMRTRRSRDSASYGGRGGFSLFSIR
ncbi:MAG: DUF1232 domain-containing protein [Rhodanobacteraceae bacterium]|nr:DUF1232 domain-containing protein [Rhodanobacteraceae bacterium]